MKNGMTTILSLILLVGTSARTAAQHPPPRQNNAFGPSVCVTEVPAGKLNILWIIAEDIGRDLGCYGNADARTPRLDQLAAKQVAARDTVSRG